MNFWLPEQALASIASTHYDLYPVNRFGAEHAFIMHKLSLRFMANMYGTEILQSSIFRPRYNQKRNVDYLVSSELQTSSHNMLS